MLLLIDKNFIRTFLIVLSIWLSNQNAFSQYEVIPSAGFSKQVDSIILNKMNQYNIPGISVGVTKNNKVIYSKGFGVKSIDTNEPVTENSIFHTASISKLFVAIAILQLVDNNYFTLDSKLVDLVPELSYKDERVKVITIQSILNHTSGLPDVSNYNWENNNQSDDALKKYVSGLIIKLRSDPSLEYHYSNLGYNILGYVVEKVTGATFEDYVKESVLDPGGMYNSDFRYFNIPDSLKTSPHSRNKITGNIFVRDTYPYTREHGPSSTLNTSVQDLNSWMIYFLQALKLEQSKQSDSRYAMMLEPSFEVYKGIGLGFQLGTLGGMKKVGHFGGDRGFRSYLFMIPQAGIGLVILANCDYDDDFRQEILHPIATLILSYE
jgi:CubicO group peptidase (beta-lactamase class C family)